VLAHPLVRLHCELVAEQQAKADDIFSRFDGDLPPLSRLIGVGNVQRGVVPAKQIERED
jgi:hypothetical protein